MLLLPAINHFELITIWIHKYVPIWMCFALCAVRETSLAVPYKLNNWDWENTTITINQFSIAVMCARTIFTALYRFGLGKFCVPEDRKIISLFNFVARSIVSQSFKCSAGDVISCTWRFVVQGVKLSWEMSRKKSWQHLC